jgi:hypothetical protein
MGPRTASIWGVKRNLKHARKWVLELDHWACKIGPQIVPILILSAPILWLKIGPNIAPKWVLELDQFRGVKISPKIVSKLVLELGKFWSST